jgi:hypothetical protein
MTQPPQQPQFQMQPVIPGNGLGIASLVLGIIALCVFCIPPLAGLLAIIAIILGVISIAQAGGAPTGKAKAGLALAVFAIVAGVVFWVVVTFVIHKAAKTAGDAIQQHSAEWQQQIDKASKQIEDAAKKQQEEMDKMKSNLPATQPGVLVYPDGRNVRVA